MSDSPALRCYLVEWYSPRLADEALNRAVAKLDEVAAAMRAEGRPIEVLMTLAVPTDEVVFGVFGAESADMVARICRQAGHPAERLTAAVDVSRGAFMAVAAEIMPEG